MYDRVIVPIDGSESSRRVLGVAAALARHHGIPLLLVTVVPPRDRLLTTGDLEEIAAPLDAPLVDTSLLFDADPAEPLVALSRRQPGALWCISSHGRGPVRQMVLGSVAARLVRDGGSPVVVVGPAFDPARPFAVERLLVCVDGSPTSEAVLPIGVQWAEAHGASLLLLQVVAPMAEAPTAADRIPQRYRGPDSYLARTCGALATTAPKAFAVVADEHPAHAIVEYAVARDASLVAMTTRGESGLALVALGSVAMAVVHTSPVPVLVVRPPAPE